MHIRQRGWVVAYNVPRPFKPRAKDFGWPVTSAHLAQSEATKQRRAVRHEVSLTPEGKVNLRRRCGEPLIAEAIVSNALCKRIRDRIVN
jgi:hypothetical protein